MPFQQKQDFAGQVLGTVDQGTGGTSAWKVDGSSVVQPVSFSGTSAVSEADGANVALGATGDASTALTVIGRLKNLLSRWPAALGSTTGAGSIPIVIASDQAAILTTPGGNVASGAADSGNPIKLGGRYNTTTPTLTDGQRGDVQLGTRGSLCVQLVDKDGTTGTSVASQAADAIGTSQAGANARVFQMLFNGSTWDRMRTPSTFRTGTATASGDTGIWTPAGGKKFRLMAFSIMVTADAATSGGADIAVILRDATVTIGLGLTLFVPAVAGTAFGNNVTTGWVTLGNGFLSGAADRVLNVNLSAALTAGLVRVVAVGTED